MGRDLYTRNYTPIFNPEEDNLLKVARAVQVIDTLDSIGRRDQQTEIQLKNYDLNRRQVELQEKNQQADLDLQLNKTTAANEIADFSKTFDPTDVEQRSRLDYIRNAAVAKGMDAREVSLGLANVDNQVTAMDNHLAILRATSGIADWERTPDGKKIDVGATIAKADYLKRELDKAATSWGPSERVLDDYLAKNNPNQTRADRMALVNENRRTLEDYQKVVSQGIWNPPEGFAQRFASTIGQDQGLAQVGQPQQIGYQPMIFNRNALELDNGYLTARGIASRIAAGEQAIFKRDEKGDIQHGPNGVAIVEKWVNVPQQTALADLSKKEAEATSAQSEAAFDTQFGAESAKAKTLGYLTSTLSITSDPTARQALQDTIKTIATTEIGTGKAATNQSQQATAAASPTPTTTTTTTTTTTPITGQPMPPPLPSVSPAPSPSPTPTNP